MRNSSTQQYFTDIDKTEVLTREAEENLYPYLSKVEIKNKLVEANLKLALKHAHRYAKIYPHLDKADIIGEANIGLMDAVAKFNPEHGFRFSTYAEHWIKKRILEFISGNSYIVKKPHASFYRAQKVKRLLGVNMPEQEICDVMDISPKQLENLKKRFTKDVAIDEEGENSGEAYELEETFIEDRYLQQRTQQLLEKCDSLSMIEKSCIDALYGLNEVDTLTTAQLSAILGRSMSNIRKIRSRSIAKLRQDLIPSHD